MREPLPAHKRAEILVRVAGGARSARRRGRAADQRRGRQADEGGPGRGGTRDVHVHDARPSRRASWRARSFRWTPRRPARASSRSRCASRSASSARSRRSTSRSTSSRTRSRRRSQPAAPSCSSRPRRRRSRRSCSPSSRPRPGSRRAGSTSSSARRRRSATSSSRTSGCALITFTGSSGVGWKLRERAPRKRVNLELGNATPVIVEADADLETAAAKVAANAFSFAGQSCISVQRVYVHARRLRRLQDAAPAEGGSAGRSATRRTRTPTSAR